MKPTLLILAAGMGSRYGGLKQIDGIGPNNEPIIEYSIYDAIKSGFGKIVFVIRKEFDKSFRLKLNKFEDMINIQYVYQEVNIKIENIEIVERTKPWGTAHAVLVAKDVIQEPFAVINADDFYGPKSFLLISSFLKDLCAENHMAMVGYKLEKTLSDHGTVNRGICKLDKENNLVEVVERTEISRINNIIYYDVDDNSEKKSLNKNLYVSMNYWGFHPSIFKEIENGLYKFIKENSSNNTAEYYIPNIITEMIKSKKMKVKVIPTSDNWFGVTYKEDKPIAVSTINKFIKSGIYPNELWD